MNNREINKLCRECINSVKVKGKVYCGDTPCKDLARCPKKQPKQQPKKQPMDSMKDSRGTLGKFFKKGFLSPPMLLVRNDYDWTTLVNRMEKTYLFEKNPDPELIKKLGDIHEGARIRIKYYHLDEDKDVRIIRDVVEQ